MDYLVYTDGGARGNPGPAAIGVVVLSSNGATKDSFGKYIGPATNNVAEYQAVIAALGWLKDEAKGQIGLVKFFLDSQLVVNQLTGLFRVKNRQLQILIATVRQLEKEVGGKIVYTAIPRQDNRKADALVNRTLDEVVF